MRFGMWRDVGRSATAGWLASSRTVRVAGWVTAQWGRSGSGATATG